MFNMEKTVMIWSLRMRLFHWVLVSLILIAWLSGDDDWMLIHSMVGYGIVLTLLFRLWIGLFGQGHERFKGAYGPGVRMFQDPLRAVRENSLQSSGHPPASAVTLGALLLMLLFAVISGVAAQGAVEMEGPMRVLLLDLSEVQAEWIEDLHELIVNAALFLIVLHIAGVLIDHFIHKSAIIHAMITGKKRQKDD
jgi:cytochrome b